jgi:hypothetical protein
MKVLVVAGLIFVTAACGAYRFPGSPSPSPETGTVSGHVIAVPCAPVEKAGDNCGGRPVEGLALLFMNGKTTVDAVTDSGGTYSVQLTPGTWKVGTKSFMRILKGPTTLTISAGSTVVANYVLDSGIRAPAPTA